MEIVPFFQYKGGGGLPIILVRIEKKRIKFPKITARGEDRGFTTRRKEKSKKKEPW